MSSVQPSMAPQSHPRARIEVRAVWILLAASAFVTLGGCSSIKDAMGISKHAPDEFAVVTKSPLIVPPEYNLLPPRPTVEQPRDADPQAEAIQALFPDHKVSPPTESEAMLLKQSGGDKVNSDIRTKIGGEDTEISERGVDTTKVLYNNTVTVPGQPQDPSIERRTPVDVQQIQ